MHPGSDVPRAVRRQPEALRPLAHSHIAGSTAALAASKLPSRLHDPTPRTFVEIELTGGPWHPGSDVPRAVRRQPEALRPLAHSHITSSTAALAASKLPSRLHDPAPRTFVEIELTGGP